MPKMGVKVDPNNYKIWKKFGLLTEVNWNSTETGEIMDLFTRCDAIEDGYRIEMNLRWIVWH